MAFQRYFVHYSVYSGKQCIIENFTPQHSGPEAEKGGATGDLPAFSLTLFCSVLVHICSVVPIHVGLLLLW